MDASVANICRLWLAFGNCVLEWDWTSVFFYASNSCSGELEGTALSLNWLQFGGRKKSSPLSSPLSVMMCRLNKKETLLIVLNMNSCIWLTSFKGNWPKGNSFPLLPPTVCHCISFSLYQDFFPPSLSNFTGSELAALVRQHYLMYSAFSSSPSPDEARLNWALALKSVELSTCS